MKVLPKWLDQASASERDDFANGGAVVRLPPGQQILALRERPGSMAFPMVGSLRVYLVGRDGREITLYRVGAGQACVLTASCILGTAAFPAIAEVETEILAWVVPARMFREWVVRSDFWRDYVFRLLGERLAAVLQRMEETSFDPVETRLARFVASGGLEMAITHQRLAEEIGSAREVVSRVLDRWRTAGWIRTRRGHIEVLDPEALRKQGCDPGSA